MVPLHIAAEEGRQKIVKFLFDKKGVDINMSDDNGVGIMKLN